MKNAVSFNLNLVSEAASIIKIDLCTTKVRRHSGATHIEFIY